MVCGSSANFPAKIFKESKMSIITLNCLLLPYEVADRSKLSEGKAYPCYCKIAPSQLGRGVVVYSATHNIFSGLY
ncbi:unnamed protein product [Rhizophagus irregularis]|nr:unnamed protein product [Rhizophagus irregularis]CAB5393432.1 unnamed protein product [Rhizophagus irregularis]